MLHKFLTTFDVFSTEVYLGDLSLIEAPERWAFQWDGESDLVSDGLFLNFEMEIVNKIDLEILDHSSAGDWYHNNDSKAVHCVIALLDAVWHSRKNYLDYQKWDLKYISILIT